MSIETQKISQSEKEQYSVKSIKGNQLTGTVEENKNVFDRQTEMLIDKYNALIDSVLDGSAAAEIGAINGEEATKVQTILSDLLERTQTAENTLLDKVDKITGKGLSTHDYDDTQTHGNKSVLDEITELSQLIVKASPNAVPSVAAIVSYVQNMGGGDMARAMYDRTQSGVVDDAERLGGELPGYYARADQITEPIAENIGYTTKADNVTAANVKEALDNLYNNQEIRSRGNRISFERCNYMIGRAKYDLFDMISKAEDFPFSFTDAMFYGRGYFDTTYKKIVFNPTSSPSGSTSMCVAQSTDYIDLTNIKQIQVSSDISGKETISIRIDDINNTNLTLGTLSESSKSKTFDVSAYNRSAKLIMTWNDNGEYSGADVTDFILIPETTLQSNVELSKAGAVSLTGGATSGSVIFPTMTLASGALGWCNVLGSDNKPAGTNITYDILDVNKNVLAAGLKSFDKIDIKTTEVLVRANLTRDSASTVSPSLTWVEVGMKLTNDTMGQWMNLGNAVTSGQNAVTIPVPSGISEVRITSNNLRCSGQDAVIISINGDSDSRNYSMTSVSKANNAAISANTNRLADVNTSSHFAAALNITGILSGEVILCEFSCRGDVFAQFGTLFYGQTEAVTAIKISAIKSITGTLHVWGR